MKVTRNNTVLGLDKYAFDFTNSADAQPFLGAPCALMKDIRDAIVKESFWLGYGGVKWT
jgi:hypothetical protein